MFSNLPSISDQFNKYFLGFDDMFERLQDFGVSVQHEVAKNWPPFNIVKNKENSYTIEMAVAGFGSNDINVEMGDGTLTITGKMQSTDEKDTGNYLFKGIAERSFTRKFSLADTVEVKNAELVNGMLKVYLDNLVPMAKAIKKIPILNGNGKTEDTRELLNEKA